MIEKLQKQLQVGGWLVVAVLALSAVWLGQSIDQTSRTGNVGDIITVSGTGTVRAVPDIAVADLAISVEGSTAASAQTEANRRSKMAIDYLKKAGIDEKDIKTSGYNIYPQYDYADGRTRIRGYQVTQSITVKIRDMDTTNTILDKVVDAGVNQVNSLRFEIDEPDQLKSEARAKAIADADAKAQELKRQLGVRLGKIVGFSESGNAMPILYGRGGGAADIKVSAVPAPELPAGENEITINVTVTYQLR
ncbi:MAG: SIMPL domain-containing protein [Candidatus Yanofskybacteria bacterium]|nr:SIMPL domain-containing protein [Candidatus Yanofskybacteria bacterium]